MSTEPNSINRIRRDADGRLPSFAWPGGYDVAYYTDDNGLLCADCANGENGSDASVDADRHTGWRLVAAESTDMWDEPDSCEHCGRMIGPEPIEECDA